MIIQYKGKLISKTLLNDLVYSSSSIFKYYAISKKREAKGVQIKREGIWERKAKEQQKLVNCEQWGLLQVYWGRAGWDTRGHPCGVLNKSQGFVILSNGDRSQTLPQIIALSQNSNHS